VPECSSLTINDLLKQAACFDVPGGQRKVVVKPAWSARLADSLHRGISIGGPIVWRPDDEGYRPLSRYQRSSEAEWWVIDGQQRLSAIYGALGQRPPWVPAGRWKAMGGPQLEVAVRLTATPIFVPAREGAQLQVTLRELIESPEEELEQLAVRAGANNPAQRAIQLAGIRARIGLASVPVHWQRGSVVDATDSFIRHNSGGSGIRLSAEEKRVAALTFLSCKSFQKALDPVADRCRQAGFPTLLGPKRVFTIAQWLMPDEHRFRSAESIDASVLLKAAADAGEACSLLIDYLHRHGITNETLLSPPTAADILAILFAKFPQAAGDDFPRRWLVHQAAYRTRVLIEASRPSSQTIRRILRADDYRAATDALAASVPAGPIGAIDVDCLQASGACWGPGGTLYALASAAGACGAVRDLGDPESVHPESAMMLRPLWRLPVRRPRPIAAYAFITEGTASAIAEHGGWGRSAYEALAPSNATLRSQHLARPATHADTDVEIGKRGAAIVKTINDYLVSVDPLTEAAQ